MSLTSTTERRYKITTVDDGNFKVLGDASAYATGFWRVQFVPNGSFVGNLLVVARSSGSDVDNDAVGFGTVPYRRVQLNGSASDYALVQTSSIDVPIASDAIIHIPASGLSIAIAVTCTAGFGYLYSHMFEGASAP